MSTPASDAAAATAALLLDYLPVDQLHSQPHTWWQQVLGVVGFSHPPDLRGRPVPVSASMTPALAASANLCEVWRASHPVSPTIQQGRVQYRFCDDLLFGALSVDEHEADQALLKTTEAAYRELFSVLGETQHCHLLRIWNYLPQINATLGGEERYRLFNSARQAAFRNSGRASMGTVPAACALGSPAGSPLSIYFLASRRAPRMIENPRQTSAYHYPPKFGKHSPIFSRACLAGTQAGTNLFISGTASIVGHETIHAGNVLAQTRETLANIKALLDEANRITGSKRYHLDSLKLKVYVRYPADLPAIQAELAAALPAAKPLYVQADVCREDLLVEIEAAG
jgi:enamine deaminase RidA (YjgF/YER057c/UK114 family)